MDKINTESGTYNIAVCDSLFGMRGIDYRSTIKMVLVIAKSFTNHRDAL